MKIRTINEAYEGLKNTDPETAMTLSGLRRLVATGKIPSIRIGRRILIDYGNVLDYLKNPPVDSNVHDDDYGMVRKIQ